MNEREAFEAMLKRDPDDPARLAFADWLDEHDEPEEADRHRRWRAAKEWMTQFATDCGFQNYDWSEDGVEIGDRITLDDVVSAGYAWLHGEYYEFDGHKVWKGEYFTQRGSEQAQSLMYDDGTVTKYWENWQILTGVRVEPEKQGQPFSCSC